MKVSVTQTGGVLGVPSRVELDSASLSDQDAVELAQRTQAVKHAPPAERQYPGELAYSVHVEPDDGDAVHASYLDSSMPDDVRDLVSWVQSHPRNNRTEGP